MTTNPNCWKNSEQKEAIMLEQQEVRPEWLKIQMKTGPNYQDLK